MRAASIRRPGTAIALMLGLIACRYQPTPVRLQGAPGDIARLAGTWEGEFTGIESHRSGTIVLTIQAGKDTAHGDVVMEAPPGQRITAADVPSGLHQQHSRAPSLLRITFVDVLGGFVEGVLEPYRAPDCECVVHTTFRGVVRGDVVKGDYLTTGPNGLRQTGRWSVARESNASAKASPP